MQQAASTGVSPVDEFTGAGRDAQLVAGVAAVAAFGAQRCDQAVFAKGAEEGGGGAAHLDGRRVLPAGRPDDVRQLHCVDPVPVGGGGAAYPATGMS